LDLPGSGGRPAPFGDRAPARPDQREAACGHRARPCAARPSIRAGAGDASGERERRLIDHVHIRVADLGQSVRFYDAVLTTVGIERTSEQGPTVEYGDFIVSAGDGPLSRDVHVAFEAASRDQVEAFHRVGVEAGYRGNGEPGFYG
jgi:hypothetical protein